MSPIVIGIIGFGIVLLLMALGIPIAVSMGGIGFLGFWYLTSLSGAIAKMAIVPFDIATSYDFSVLPLFILMAEIIVVTGMGTDLFNLAAKWLGRLPGGLAIATIGGCAGFAAVSASSIATATTIGGVAIPEMKKSKYNMELATGSVIAGGTLGILIPPSGPMIIYGVLTQTSIGKLYAAGIVPGIIAAIFYMVTIVIICTINPSLGPRGPKTNFREKVLALGNCAEIIGLVILVFGGLIIGFFTPTEAGALGAFGAIIFSLIRRRLNWQGLKQAFISSSRTIGMIYAILIGAFLLNSFVTVSMIPTALCKWLTGLSLSPLAVMSLIIVLYIILGTAMDEAAMLVLTVPVLTPLIQSLNFDLVWFGIIMMRMMAIATISPPVGMNLFVVSGIAKDVPIERIFKGIIPFFISDILFVALILFVPGLVLFLPNMMR